METLIFTRTFIFMPKFILNSNYLEKNKFRETCQSFCSKLVLKSTAGPFSIFITMNVYPVVIVCTYKFCGLINFKDKLDWLFSAEG